MYLYVFLIVHVYLGSAAPSICMNCGIICICSRYTTCTYLQSVFLPWLLLCIYRCYALLFPSSTPQNKDKDVYWLGVEPYHWTNGIGVVLLDAMLTYHIHLQPESTCNSCIVALNPMLGWRRSRFTFSWHLIYVQYVVCRKVS
jgi:hypothetical protein